MDEKKPIAVINNPPYYQGKGGLDVIEVIEAFDLDFHRGNAVAYILRAGRKTKDSTEDIKKAIWYLNRFLDQDIYNDIRLMRSKKAIEGGF